jgi:hypothetical protein
MMIMQVITYHVFCDMCGEDLGIDRPFFAQEHLKKFPTRRKGFTQKRSSLTCKIKIR